MKHILLIEDALIASVAESAVLEELGCTITLAFTGREAIEKTLQAQDYMLILMDLGLPDLDALTVTESIVINYARHNKTPPPIVALTAHAYESLHVQCMEAGMSDFLAKPLTTAMARALLEKY